MKKSHEDFKIKVARFAALNHVRAAIHYFLLHKRRMWLVAEGFAIRVSECRIYSLVGIVTPSLEAANGGN